MLSDILGLEIESEKIKGILAREKALRQGLTKEEQTSASSQQSQFYYLESPLKEKDSKKAKYSDGDSIQNDANNDSIQGDANKDST